MFYLIEISTGDSKIAGKSVYEYDDVTLATAAFHTKLGAAMKSDLYTSELILIMDSDGVIIKEEKYNREVSD